MAAKKLIRGFQFPFADEYVILNNILFWFQMEQNQLSILKFDVVDNLKLCQFD